MNKQESECKGITNEIDRKSSNDKCDVTGIYGLRCKTTGKWYVGQSVNILKRWNDYRYRGCKKQRKLEAAFLKYGFSNFDKIILEECLEQELTSKEDHWMGVYDSIENGYNIRNAGSKGKQSVETCKKISNALTGRKLSKEHISKLPQNQKGRKQSSELVKKRADSMRGSKWSDERKSNYRILMKDKRIKRTKEEINLLRRERYRKSREGIVPWQSLIGKPRDQATKAKISLARRTAELIRNEKLRQEKSISIDPKT